MPRWNSRSSVIPHYSACSERAAGLSGGRTGSALWARQLLSRPSLPPLMSFSFPQRPDHPPFGLRGGSQFGTGRPCRQQGGTRGHSLRTGRREGGRARCCRRRRPCRCQTASLRGRGGEPTSAAFLLLRPPSSLALARAPQLTAAMYVMGSGRRKEGVPPPSAVVLVAGFVRGGRGGGSE